MTAPIPDHLFEQADTLLRPPAAGEPRQTDLRRAISNAYYGLFHHTARAIADELVGASKRQEGTYRLLYRSIEHRRLKDVCVALAKPTPSSRYRAYLPNGSVGADLKAFMVAVSDLQERRHSADYDPGLRFRLSDSTIAISTARNAIARFGAAPSDECRAFLMLLVADPRPV